MNFANWRKMKHIAKWVYFAFFVFWFKRIKRWCDFNKLFIFFYFVIYLRNFFDLLQRIVIAIYRHQPHRTFDEVHFYNRNANHLRYYQQPPKTLHVMKKVKHHNRQRAENRNRRTENPREKPPHIRIIVLCDYLNFNIVYHDQSSN